MELLEGMYKTMRSNDQGCFDALDFNQLCYYAYKHSSNGNGNKYETGQNEEEDPEAGRATLSRSRSSARVGRVSLGSYYRDDEVNIFRKDHGGMKSYRLDPEDGNEIVGEEILYVGIIDTLITFAEFKQSEHFVRSNVEGKNISVVPPDQYAPRFMKFVTQAVV
eukprot:TRINITY_DN12581_c0_g1_i1.p1 TRINITY_DN12581_c0_g1~~TRINITY_DN12581_c0_g1_i1.p1  ORF type:complete len:164 (+),score=36.35 TRINITY_DN12581_c0_g1_i1:249-740(+)